MRDSQPWDRGTNPPDTTWGNPQSLKFLERIEPATSEYLVRP